MRSDARPHAGWATTVVRLAFVLPIFASLVAGVASGLIRAGVQLPASVAGPWSGPAIVGHAFLMICTFMGTIIGIERAVAVKHPFAFAGPLASGLAGVALLSGAELSARWLVAAASLAFITANIVVVARQRAAHTLLLLVAALAWATGSLLHALDAQAGVAVPWWFSFLVLTIAAERLEMTRLMRRRQGASTVLYGIFSAMVLGAAFSGISPTWGGALYGLSLIALSVWLMAFDIARRTVYARGLSRYMAVCLLLGYFWLFVSGATWAATSLGLPWRDAALHALGLGFVFSMMLGHAPVILPAIARLKVYFGWVYYVPLSLLHGSLVIRLTVGAVDVRALEAGAAVNALAIVAFIGTAVGSAIAWRFKHAPPHSRHGVSAEH